MNMEMYGVEKRHNRDTGNHTMLRTTEDLIESLGLIPHPEGGFYRETYRSDKNITATHLEGERSAYTTIYYLLDQGSFSAWHRIWSDETWLFHAGGELDLFQFDSDGQLIHEQLGPKANRYQLTVPAGRWFAAKPAEPDQYGLVSCFVAPGFEFGDFELANRDDLLRTHGTTEQNRELITRFSR